MTTEAVNRAVTVERVLLDRYPALFHRLAPTPEETLAGPCPLCASGDAAAFRIMPREESPGCQSRWSCRACQRRGGVVELVAYLDGCSLAEAAARLAGYALPPELRSSLSPATPGPGRC